jgi:hypothetical protein
MASWAGVFPALPGVPFRPAPLITYRLSKLYELVPLFNPRNSCRLQKVRVFQITSLLHIGHRQG